MKSSRIKLEQLSKILNAEEQFYTYNREAKEASKYRKGALTSIKYLQELITYYIDCEIKLQDEFLKKIEEQEKIIMQLNKTEYKQAILDMTTFAKYEIRDKKPERVSVIQSKKKY